MKLDQFIESYGASKLARKIGVSAMSVSYWKAYSFVPSYEKQEILIKLSKNQMSYESIAKDFLKHKASKQKGRV